MILLRHQIIEVLFQHGGFDAASTALTAWALLFSATGLSAISMIRVAVPAFYALGDMRTPVKLAFIAFILNIVLNLMFIRPLQNGGPALATSIAAFFNAFALLVIFRRRYGPLGLRAIARSTMKFVIASVALSFVTYVMIHWPDAWNTACRLEEKTNCAESNGPDFDFASPPILVTLPNGRRALVAGQKSGMVHAIDPEREGEVLWQTRVGKGGINGGVQWGSAADQSNVYVALSDIERTPVPNSQATEPDPKGGGGMFALRLDNGQQVWHTPPPSCGDRKRCSPA